MEDEKGRAEAQAGTSLHKAPADHGKTLNSHADLILIVLDATQEEDAFGSIAPALMGFKNGAKTFERQARILR